MMDRDTRSQPGLAAHYGVASVGSTSANKPTLSQIAAELRHQIARTEKEILPLMDAALQRLTGRGLDYSVLPPTQAMPLTDTADPAGLVAEISFLVETLDRKWAVVEANLHRLHDL